MITALLGLLGGLLADAGEQGARRGRLHELQGRLGLRQEKAPSDLRSRLLYNLGLTVKLDPEIRHWLDGTFLGLAAAVTASRITWQWLDSDGNQVTSTFPIDVQRAIDQYSIHGPGRVMGWPLPLAGRTSRFEPLWAWVYQRMVHAVQHIEGSVWGQSYMELHEPGELPHFTPVVLGRIADWFDQTHPDLGRYSWGAAAYEAAAWHLDLQAGVNYRGKVPPALVMVTFPDGSHIDRLVTNQQFIDEGESMGHCIGGQLDDNGTPSGNSHYYQESRNGLGMAFSYRDPDGVPQATVYLWSTSRDEEADLVLDQIQGPDDGMVRYDAARRMAWFINELFAGLGAAETELLTEDHTILHHPLSAIQPLLTDFSELTRRTPNGGMDVGPNPPIVRATWVMTADEVMKRISSMLGFATLLWWPPDIPDRPRREDDPAFTIGPILPEAIATRMTDPDTPLPVARTSGIIGGPTAAAGCWTIGLSWPTGTDWPVWTAWHYTEDYDDGAPVIATYRARSLNQLIRQAKLDVNPDEVMKLWLSQVDEEHPQYNPLLLVHDRATHRVAALPLEELLPLLGLEIRKGKLVSVRPR